MTKWNGPTEWDEAITIALDAVNTLRPLGLKAGDAHLAKAINRVECLDASRTGYRAAMNGPMAELVKAVREFIDSRPIYPNSQELQYVVIKRRDILEMVDRYQDECVK